MPFQINLLSHKAKSYPIFWSDNNFHNLHRNLFIQSCGQRSQRWSRLQRLHWLVLSEQNVLGGRERTGEKGEGELQFTFFSFTNVLFPLFKLLYSVFYFFVFSRTCICHYGMSIVVVVVAVVIVTSLAKEVMFLVAFVCLFVCGQHHSKSYERIGMKFYGGVLGSTMKNWLNFGGDVGILRWLNEQKKKP